MSLSNPFKIILAAALTFSERHTGMEAELFRRLKLHVDVQLYRKYKRYI
jgi:hypothetical protein